MIHVIATVDLEPGKRDQFLAAFAQVRPKVLAEEGCLDYGAAVDVPTSLPAQTAVGDDAVTIVERWASIENLEAHLVAEHMLEYRASVKELVKGTKLQILQPV